MGIDFTSLSSTPTANTRGKAAEPASTTASSSNGSSGNSAIPSSTGDTVKLSDAAKALQRAEHENSNIPDVDSERVEQLKAEIEGGTYQVDSKKVAEGILRFEELLG